jgi:hypothetical protein
MSKLYYIDTYGTKDTNETSSPNPHPKLLLLSTSSSDPT